MESAPIFDARDGARGLSEMQERASHADRSVGGRLGIAGTAFGREEFVALAAKKKSSRRSLFTRQSVMPTEGLMG